MFHPGLQDLIQKQKKHDWYASPARISQIITPLAKTWLYWKKIYLYWPEDAESPIEHCWRDGFQPILSFGLTEKNAWAALVAAPWSSGPFWVVPGDFIQDIWGIRLMKNAASLPKADEIELQSVVVTAVHPRSKSQCGPAEAFKQLLEQASDVPWLYEPEDGPFGHLP
jgi:hypothetical protein